MTEAKGRSPICFVVTLALRRTWVMWVKLGNDNPSAISIVKTATVDDLNKKLIATFKKLGGCDPGELVVKAPKESLPEGLPWTLRRLSKSWTTPKPHLPMC